jgi:hypothetical protein
MKEITKTRMLINKLGGVKVVAEWCGIKPSTVYEWVLVPSKHQRTILINARLAGKDLIWEDFL